jgi:O-antigen/teichoic acid export membrane protein
VSFSSNIAQRFGWFAVERALRLCIAFVIGVAVARHLGPENFGLLSYAVSTVAVFSVLFTLGIDGLVVRDLSVSESRAPVILGTALCIRFFAGCVGAGLCCVYMLVANSSKMGGRGIVMVQSLVMLFGWGEVLDYWFQSRPDPKIGVCARMGANLLGGGMRLLLIWADAPTMAFVLAGVVEVMVLAGAMWQGFKLERVCVAPLRFDRAQAADLLKRGWSLALSATLVMGILQGDRILLGRLAGREEMGWYAASARFLDLLLMLPMLLGMSVQRVFAREAHAGPLARSSSVWRVWVVANWVGLSAAVLMWAGSRWVVPWVFGPNYVAAAPILTVHAWIVIFVMQVSMRTRMLIAEGQHVLVLWLSLATAAVQFTLLPMAIRLGGGVGAAYATLLAWFFGALVAPLLFRKTRWFVLAFPRAILFPFRA